MKRRLFSWLLRLAVLVGLLVVGLGVVAVYLRRDKTEVFYEVRGDYAGHDVIAHWRTAESEVRLIGLHNDRGEEVSQAYVRRGDHLQAVPRIVVIYAGAKTRERILDLIPDRPNFVLVAMQYPYRSPEGALDHLRWPAHARRAAYRTVAGGMLAVSFLEEEEQLDLSRSIIVGSSLGSIPATIHGALDDRVPTVLLVHGGGDLRMLVRANVRPAWAVPPAELLSAVALDTFDPLHYVARISPRELVMIAAENDTYFPPESSRKLFERARQPKQITWTRTEHVRSKKTELVAEIVRQIEGYLDAQERSGG